jgi:hypothetical protein
VLALTIAVAAWVEVVVTPEFVDLVGGTNVS